MGYPLQPLRLQTGWAVMYNDFTEYDMEKHGEGGLSELHEDLLQLWNERASLTLDLGWYPDGDPEGRYVLLLVRGDRWDQPLARFMTRSKTEMVARVERWTGREFYGKYCRG